MRKRKTLVVRYECMVTSGLWCAMCLLMSGDNEQFVGMVANMLMVERFGRRTLVLTSLAFVTLSLLALGKKK